MLVYKIFKQDKTKQYKNLKQFKLLISTVVKSIKMPSMIVTLNLCVHAYVGQPNQSSICTIYTYLSIVTLQFFLRFASL